MVSEVGGAERGHEARIDVLDGWRGFAVLGVLFAHFIVSSPINLGRFGVELFFVLSGRLMAEILFVKRMPLPKFYARRFSRIYPAMAVYVLTVLLLSSLTSAVEIDWPAALSALTFTYNYYAVFTEHAPELSHIWSLCIEEHIYILLGLLALAQRQWAVPVAPVIFALAAAFIVNGFVLTYGFGEDYYDAYWRTDVRGSSILLGAGTFLVLRQYLSGLDARTATIACVVLSAVAFATNFNAVPDPIKYSLGSACLALAVNLLEHVRGPVQQLLAAPALTAIGLASYSLYLWQQLFAKLAWDIPSRFAMLLPAIAVGVLSYRLIEGPARRLINAAVDRRLARAG